MPMETIRLGIGAQRLPKRSKYIPKSINYTPINDKQSNDHSTPKVVPQQHRTWNHEYPPKDFSSILKLLFHITLLIMILTWIAIRYPIKVASILVNRTINFLIPPTDAELVGIYGRTREGYDSLGLRAFPNYNLIIMQYILITWWLQLLDRLGHYVIRPWEIEQVPVMNNNIMTLVYTYAKLSINNPPDIFCKLAYTVRIIVWIPSWLAWTPELRGRDQSLLLPSQLTAFYGTSNQEVPTPFENSTR